MRVWQAWLCAGAMVVATGCGALGGAEIKVPTVPKVEVPKLDPYVPECMASKEAVGKAGELIRMKAAPEQAAPVAAWPLTVKGFQVALPSGTYRGLRFVLTEGRLGVFYLTEKTRVAIDQSAMSALLADLPADETQKIHGEVSDWSKHSEGLLSAAPTAYDYNYLGFRYGLDGVDCETKGRGPNTVLLAAYPVAGTFAAGKQASAVFMPVVPAAPPAVEGQEAPPAPAPLEGMVVKGKTVNPATQETFEAWSTMLRVPGQREGLLAEYTVLGEGSTAESLAFATGHTFAAADKAPKWLPALQAAIDDPSKGNINALKKGLTADKKLDKETLASIEQVVQQIK
jgi:hypothetical protein